jgi:biopolymer transport protein ExbB/TolQ
MNDWEDAERRVEKAQELFEQRRWLEALEELRAATSINPYNASWFFNIGLTLDEMERYEEAIEICNESPGYLTNVAGAALRMREAGYQEMISGLEAAANEETFKLNTKISYLSLLGNVAPLLGLLGTVTGMISSFQTIETLKAPTPGDLAKGVYESLVNTTMGLFIAIVFLTVYFLFKNKVSKLCLSINLQAVDMLRHLAIAEKTGGGAGAASHG